MVHQVGGEDGPYVRDDEGKLFNPKLVLGVPPDSRSLKVPRFLQETGMANRDEKREQLWPWARRIHQRMKEQGDTVAALGSRIDS